MKKTLFKALICTFFLISFFSISVAQVSSLSSNRNMIRIYEKYINAPDARVHTSIKPYKAADIYKVVYPDSLYQLTRIVDAERKLNRFINVIGYEDILSFDENGLIRHYEYDTIYPTVQLKVGKKNISYQPRKFHIAINPIINFQYGYEQVDGDMLSVYRQLGYNKNRTFFQNHALSQNLRGLSVKVEIGKKISFYTAFMEHQARYPAYILGSESAYNKSVVPGEGKVRVFKQRGFDFSRIEGYFTYRPNKYFETEIGHGKHFIGDGYRSLLLSDNSFVYPYARFTTNFWRIRYTNIFTEFQNNINSDRDFALGFPRKLGSFIYVSADLAKWFQLGVFEGIIWPRTGPEGNTEFDFNYLNPIIGIRGLQKIEANTLYGLNLKFLAPKNFVFYGQLMIDKFGNLSSYENRTGFQGGIKYLDAFGVNNLNLQFEFNRVRPYAYSYSDSMLHYSHYSQALAHPLGANFNEFVGIIDYRWKRIYAEWKVNVASGAVDNLNDNLNHGSNIFVDNTTATITENVSVGQGDGYNLFHNAIRFGYILNPKINLTIEAKVVSRFMQYQNNTLNNNMFFFTLSTQLFNNYHDFAFNY